MQHRAGRITTGYYLMTLNVSVPHAMTLSAWAQTAVGDALAGTTFVVTERDDD